MSAKKPVTVLTGFLGAGKTTLLRHILKYNKKGIKIAVIENEFSYRGAVPLTDELHGEDRKAICTAEIKETTSGCICCSGVDDFLNLMYQLIKSKSKFEYVLVETTGMADPSFVKLFYTNKLIRENFYLDGIVCVVDALNGLKRLKEKKISYSTDVTVINEAVEQVIFADRIIINKMDLAKKSGVKKLKAAIKSLNAMAPIYEAERAKVNLENLIEIKAFRVDAATQRDTSFLDIRPNRKHDGEVSSTTFGVDGNLEQIAFRMWLKTMLASLKNLDALPLRIKGIVHFADERFVLQGVEDAFTLENTRVKETGTKKNTIVFIAKALPTNYIKKSFSMLHKGKQLYIQGPSFWTGMMPVFGILAIIFWVAFPWADYAPSWVLENNTAIVFTFAIAFYTVRTYLSRRNK